MFKSLIAVQSIEKENGIMSGTIIEEGVMGMGENTGIECCIF
jgi:hypothetical protein